MEVLTIVNIITAVVMAASIILTQVAPITKTNKDNKVLKIVNRVLEVLSIHSKR